MNRLNEIAEEISQCFGYDVEQVKDRLVQELFETGFNVKQAAENLGVTPHQYDEKMGEFYKETDAFVFESVIDNERPYRELISDRIIGIIEKQFVGANDVKILDLGGGIGSDCSYLAKNGYKNITYFEFDGPTCKFAKYRFTKYGVSSNIEIINALSKIPQNYFDIVVSIEVLEHVEDPNRMVRELYGYLKEEGIAIVTESFSRVESIFPTHLRSNLRYSGMSVSLFRSHGFTLVDGYFDFRPLIFAKGLGLKEKIAYYFDRKLFKLRFKMLYERFKHIVNTHLLS